MIRIEHKKDCCGCSACASICPKNCINLNEDAEGFLSPVVNENICINCDLCVQVCPIISHINIGKKLCINKPIGAFAAKSKNNNILFSSSSGGVFSELAADVLKNNGIVFGAAFDEKWRLVHTHVKSIDELRLLQGSKYLQSDMATSFKDAKKYLNEGMHVLFSGTPCQIDGLKRFLRKDYKNLLTVEVICHGVPPAKLFYRYLGNLKKHLARANKSELNMHSINFRYKPNNEGWIKYFFRAVFASGDKAIVFEEPHFNNIYMRAFLKDLCLQESCYECPSKGMSSGADITLGDFWGIEKLMLNFDSSNGVSAVIANTQTGYDAIQRILDKLELVKTSVDKIEMENPALSHSAKRPLQRNSFFESVYNSSNFEKSIKSFLPSALHMTTIKILSRLKILPFLVFIKKKLISVK